MFLPSTREETDKLGWERPDIILVTGDAYIDSPFIGIAVIGRTLEKAGYKVGIIAQPDANSTSDISRLGEPRLFWGVSAGSVDSMVSNYTPTKKRRNNDDLTPGGINVHRPDRATIAYVNLIRRAFKNTRPIVIGGIEASLRRIADYDHWDNGIRRSILLDAKADVLVYGMGEKAVTEIARKLDEAETSKETDTVRSFRDIKGICYISGEPKKEFIMLPSFDDVKKDKHEFKKMFEVFYRNNDAISAKGLCQKYDARYLVHNPPQPNLTSHELDAVYELPYERDVHPFDRKKGEVRALDTIKFSITSHRGCYGECSFCAITVHQGRTIVSRSISSIEKEAKHLALLPGFKGYIFDVGGPTANMFGIECEKKLKSGACPAKRCIYPKTCSEMKIDHGPQIEMLARLRKIKGIKKVFVASGLRYDMILDDSVNGAKYLNELVEHHVSGQLKIAPEHTEPGVLKLMGKSGVKELSIFKDKFDRLNNMLDKKQFLTYYFIAAHPGCTDSDMIKLKKYIGKKLRTNPEQVQIFTPTPSTYSTLMYYLEEDPFTGEKLFVEKDNGKKQKQKDILLRK